MKKLPFQIKAGYSSLDIALIAVEVVLQLYLLKFYVTEMHLSPTLVGIAMAIAILWDAITDPIMGSVSDSTRSRIGRRRLYILIGGICLTLSFPLLFLNVGDLNTWQIFTQLLITYILINTSLTIIAIPHSALGAEIAPDQHERTSLYGFKLFFGNIGLLIGTLSPYFFTAGFEGAVFYTSVLIAFSSAVTTVIAFLSTKKWDNNRRRSIFSLKYFFTSTKGVFRHRAFRIILIAFTIATIARTINSSIALFYYENFLGLSGKEVIINILGTFIVAISISIPFWIYISRIWGKIDPASWAIMLLGIGTTIVYPLFAKGSLPGPIAAAVVGGFLVGSVILFDSLVGDIAVAEQKEGIYFGFWRMSTKVSRAFGISLTGLLLTMIGFDEKSTHQSSSTSFGLSMIFGPVVGSLFALSGIIFRRTKKIRILQES